MKEDSNKDPEPLNLQSQQSLFRKSTTEDPNGALDRVANPQITTHTGANDFTNIIPPEVIEALKSGNIRGFGEMMIRGQVISSPFPPPEIIAGYEKALPGAGDRVMKMAELEQAKHHEQIERVTNQKFSVLKRGQLFGFFLGLTGILTGGALLMFNKPIGGFTVFLTSLAALIGTSIYNNRKNDTKRSSADQPRAQSK